MLRDATQLLKSAEQRFWNKMDQAPDDMEHNSHHPPETSQTSLQHIDVSQRMST